MEVSKQPENRFSLTSALPMGFLLDSHMHKLMMIIGNQVIVRRSINDRVDEEQVMNHLKPIPCKSCSLVKNHSNWSVGIHPKRGLLRKLGYIIKKMDFFFA